MHPLAFASTPTESMFTPSAGPLLQLTKGFFLHATSFDGKALAAEFRCPLIISKVTSHLLSWMNHLIANYEYFDYKAAAGEAGCSHKDENNLLVRSNKFGDVTLEARITLTVTRLLRLVLFGVRKDTQLTRNKHLRTVGDGYYDKTAVQIHCLRCISSSNKRSPKQ